MAKCFLCDTQLRKDGFLEFIKHPLTPLINYTQVNFQVKDGLIMSLLAVCSKDYKLAIDSQDVFLLLVQSKVEAMIQGHQESNE